MYDACQVFVDALINMYIPNNTDPPLNNNPKYPVSSCSFSEYTKIPKDKNNPNIITIMLMNIRKIFRVFIFMFTNSFLF